MNTEEKERIECAIRHIKTAVDVDPWAVAIAVDAMENLMSPTEMSGSPDNCSEFLNNTGTDTNAGTYEWIPCKDKMPDPDQLVLMQCRGKKWPSGYRYFQVLGVWIPPLTVKAEDKWTQDSDTEDLEVYDEDTNTYYCEAGWYEETTQGDGDNMSWKMNADVIAWMPLPESYKGGADESQTD